MTEQPLLPPRRRWPWIVAIVIVIAALIVTLVAFNLQPHSPRMDASNTPTPTRTQPAAAAAPTGCLGGPNRDATMLLAAQKAAPHTTTGAVEVAAALVRWTFRYPAFSQSEANQVSAAVISKSATPEFRDLAGGAKSTPNNSGGVVPNGTPFYLSTAPGVWYLESSSKNAVTVSIGAGYVVDGALSPELRSSTTVEMVWEDGVWKAEGGSIKRTTEELFRIGLPFTGGC
jgi:hypothetical protein